MSGVPPSTGELVAIIPTYIGTDERSGRTLFGLNNADFRKVAQGYGCPTCLEDFNGVYHVTCPVCGHTRNVAQDVLPTPRWWMPDPSDPERYGA
jgi:hypothetical protein